MSGWRARIGFVNPTRVMGENARELYRMAPEGVSFAFTSLGMYDPSPEEMERGLGRIEEVVGYLAKTGVDFVILAGSPPVILHGPGADREIIQRAERAAGVPATTSTTAAMEAMRFLSLKRIVIASPYQSQNAALGRFLAAEGFDVLHSRGLETPYFELGQVPPEAVFKLAKRTFLEAPEAEGLYIPGKPLHASHHVHVLEQDLGVPVVASTQASLWAALRALRIRERISGYGHLLESLGGA